MSHGPFLQIKNKTVRVLQLLQGVAALVYNRVCFPLLDLNFQIHCIKLEGSLWEARV